MTRNHCASPQARVLNHVNFFVHGEFLLRHRRLVRNSCDLWTLLFIFCIGHSQLAMAWGERGHDLVARVAARLLIQDHSAAPQLTQPFAFKEHMLGHLANVPDIVWRNGDAATREQNSPTHYFNIDRLIKMPSATALPLTISQAYAAAKEQKLELSNRVGTAPWRIQQLGQSMRQQFADAGKALARKKPSEKGLNAAVDRALLHGGIMAHFVGDLGNPMHTVADYDGYGSGQGGLHAYFESEAVGALDLTLDHEVMQAALLHPLKPLRTKYASQLAKLDAPLEIAWILVLDSFGKRDQILQLDKQHALLRPSQQEPLQIAATRRPAADTATKFRPLIVERLALAANALAEIWFWSWQAAGKPNLADYMSWEYPVRPDFIEPDYLL